MKPYHVLLTGLFLLFATFRSEAQPAAAPPATKIAVFDTDALGDKKAGAKRMLAAYEQLQREFKPLQDEINNLRAKADALYKTINDTQAVADPNVIRAKRDEYDTMARDIQRKSEYGQETLDKRRKELTDPIFTHINTALEAYAKQRGFDIVFDVSKFAGAVMILNQSIDITTAFINDYNTKNPVVPAGVPAK